MNKHQQKADPRVVRFKLAAEILCQKTGDNPNTITVVPHETLAGVTLQVPLWYALAEKMLGLSLMLRSIKEANDREIAAANDAKVEVPLASPPPQEPT